MAEQLYELVKQSKTSTIALEAIVQQFAPKINKLLYMTNLNDRKDLEQELKIKLIEHITKYDIDSVPGFWEMKENIQRKAEKS